MIDAVEEENTIILGGICSTGGADMVATEFRKLLEQKGRIVDFMETQRVNRLL